MTHLPYTKTNGPRKHGFQFKSVTNVNKNQTDLSIFTNLNPDDLW